MAFRSRQPARLLLLFTAVLLALTTAAPAFAALNPSVWSAEVYCGGRVIQSIGSTFSGSIETTWTALVNGAQLPGTAAEPTTADSTGSVGAAAVGTVSSVLPASLPNTAGAALPLAGLAAAAVAAIAVGRRITRWFAQTARRM
jgi:hypothetical protein